MSEAALAPTMGPVTEEESAALKRWHKGALGDPELWKSLPSVGPHPSDDIDYVLVRALRAGVPLEKLL